jgi:hypothetical protein
MCVFLLRFALFQYTCRQPISVTNLGRIVKKVKSLISFVLQICEFKTSF